MWGQQFASLVLVLGITNMSHALPGFQARDCGGKIDDIFCSNTASTMSGVTTTRSTIDTPSSITPGPSFVVQAHRRDTDDVTNICGPDECTKYDVSSSFIGVFPVPHFTGDPRPPFANDTELAQPHPGPTASGTGVVSGTSISRTSSVELNGTTFITSKVTISVLTITGETWSDWTSAPNGTAAGTGRQPLNSANATNVHHSLTASGWSIWPLSTGSPNKPSLNATNSAHVSAGQTSTRAHPSPIGNSCVSNETTCSPTTTSVSYYTTSTFIFAHSTVIIPIPADYSASVTSKSTSTPKHTPKHTSSASIGGRISTASCWTTTDKFTSGTKSSAVIASSKICWTLLCDENDKCTDRVSRYPITVDAQSTASMTSPSNGNSTVMPTTTTSSDNSVLATVTSSSSHDTVWMTWSAVRNVTKSSSSYSSPSSESESTSKHSTKHTRSVDATSTSPSSPSSSNFQSTFPLWLSWTSATSTTKHHSTMSSDPIAHPSLSVEGTLTETVYPLSATDTETAASMTSEDAFQVRGAMMNRKRFLREQKLRKGSVEGVKESGMYE